MKSMRRYSFVIPSDAKEGRLLGFIKRMLPEVPEYALREAFRSRDVKVNGSRVSIDAMLTPGAEVCVYTRDTKAARTLTVVYEDENVLVTVKPAGISCEEDEKGGRTLTQLLHAQMLAQNTEATKPLLCHRLDNPTEGLIVLAKTPEVQELLVQAFRDRQVHKEYTCVVRGTPNPRHAVLIAYLVKDAAKARVYVTRREEPGAKRIVTEYEVLEAGECARLCICLHTGRTHQIRAHMAYAGYPLLGDDLYGDRALNKRMKTRRLMLCATSLSFSMEGKLSYLNKRTFTYQPSF